MKSRKKQKSTAPGAEAGPSLALQVLRNPSVQLEGTIDSSAVDKFRASDLSLSPLAPTGGVPEQLLMCSEEIVVVQDKIVRYTAIVQFEISTRKAK